jgi:hypothetical protein
MVPIILTSTRHGILGEVDLEDKFANGHFQISKMMILGLNGLIRL